MSQSPTSRSMEFARGIGLHVQVVERWLPFARVRQDLFGFIDLVAMQEGEPLLAIQATSTSNLAARVKKALASPLLRVWLSTGCRFECWGWALKGAKGKAKRWTLTRRVLCLADTVAPPDDGQTAADCDAITGQ